MARNTSEYQLWQGSSDISDQKITRKSKKLSKIFSFHQICLIMFFENPCEKITRKSEKLSKIFSFHQICLIMFFKNPCEKITRKSEKLSKIFSFHQICLIMFFENPCEKIARKSSSPENHPNKSPDISPTKTARLFTNSPSCSCRVSWPCPTAGCPLPASDERLQSSQVADPHPDDWGDVVKHVKKKVSLVIYSDFLVISR